MAVGVTGWKRENANTTCHNLRIMCYIYSFNNMEGVMQIFKMLSYPKHKLYVTYSLLLLSVTLCNIFTSRTRLQFQLTWTLSSGALTWLSLRFLVCMNPDRPFSSRARTPIPCPGQLPSSKCCHTYTHQKYKDTHCDVPRVVRVASLDSKALTWCSACTNRCQL